MNNPPPRIVLFVCTGNICRSPMAEALFNNAARQRNENNAWLARSVGTWALDHQAASGHAQTVMAKRGIDLSAHRGRTVTRAEVAEADVVIAMTQNHHDALGAQFPEYRHKIHLMSEIAGRVYDIADPYGGVLDEYEATARELESLIQTGYTRIQAWANATL